MNAIKNKKIRSSMIIEIDIFAMINRFVKKNIIDENILKNCELFFKKCKLTQCFNCHQYEHIVKRCNNFIKCEHCVKKHAFHACFVQNATKNRQCAICEKKKHETWFHRCKTKMNETKKIQIAYESRTILHEKISNEKFSTFTKKTAKTILCVFLDSVFNDCY